MEMLGAIVIIFMLIPLPIWIVLHYRSLNKKTAGLSKEEHQSIERLTQIAHKMTDRIEALESILDKEAVDWRGKHERL